MTANAGYHAYATGDVLTAAQVQFNLQNQVIMYFATSGARTTALSGVVVEGMFSYIPGNGLEYYNGSAWTAVGGGAAAAGTLTGTTLASNVVTSSLTSFGTTPTLVKATETNPYIYSPKEFTTITATAATGTVACDLLTQGILYYTTNASANWTLNFRGNSTTTLASLMNVGDAWSFVFLNTNGATAYYPTVFQVDGTVTGVTTKWSGGTAPTAGNASAVDSYSFTILKTAATPTYTVLAGGAVKFA